MKTLEFNKLLQGFETGKVKPIWLLVAGVILFSLSHMTWNVDFLAWFSMIPFLLYLHRTRGWKSRVIFAIFLILTWSVIVLKIITEPIPYFLIPLYSVPIALIHLPGYLLYDKVKSSDSSVLIFPAAMITLEWIQYTFTPLASWGVAAYTQVDSINILQSTSIFGLSGLSFLIYFTNSAITNRLTAKKSSIVNTYAPVTTIFILIIFGHLRLDLSQTKGKDTIKVAAVGTDSKIGGLPLPEFETHIEVIQSVFKRTIKAANLGAKLIVWNEAAFYLPPGKEKAWKDSISTLAKKYEVGITAAYVMPRSMSPFRYENKLVLFGPDGEIKNEYLKHEPVPGEPAVKGTEEIISTTMFGSEIGGAICYDYDFPYLARKNMLSNANIVALPSSDWRGIDPLHTKMARLRAIEQGHSIIRSTRFGLSATINPHGEMTAKMSSFDRNDKILISDIPLNGIKTIYSIIGDSFIYINIGFLLIFLLKFLFVRGGKDNL